MTTLDFYSGAGKPQFDEKIRLRFQSGVGKRQYDGKIWLRFQSGVGRLEYDGKKPAQIFILERVSHSPKEKISLRFQSGVGKRQCDEKIRLRFQFGVGSLEYDGKKPAQILFWRGKATVRQKKSALDFSLGWVSDRMMEKIRLRFQSGVGRLKYDGKKRLRLLFLSG